MAAASGGSIAISKGATLVVKQFEGDGRDFVVSQHDELVLQYSYRSDNSI
jgi:hypothetical protein